MKEITFRFKDAASQGKWRTRHCIVKDEEECKRIYGLDTDPTVYAYEFLEIKEKE